MRGSWWLKCCALGPATLVSMSAFATGPLVANTRVDVSVHNTTVNIHNTNIQQTLVVEQPEAPRPAVRGFDLSKIRIHAPGRDDDRRPSINMPIARRPERPKTAPKLLYAVPPESTPDRPNVPRQVLVKSWGTKEERIDHINDPWEAFFKGYDKGEQVTIEKQLPSQPITSLSKDAIPLGAPKMAARGMLREALEFEKVLSVDVDQTNAPHRDDYRGDLPWSATAEKQGTEQLEIHAPLRIKGKLDGKSTGPAVYTQVKGLATEVSEKRIDMPRPPGMIRQLGYTTIKTTKSGELQKHYAAWIQPENVRVSPAYEDENGRPTADFVGLAAFPIGAKVRVTNLDLEKADREHATVELDRKWNGRKSKTGSVRGRLPVTKADATYRLEVVLPGRYNAARTVTLTSTFQLPDARSAEVQKGGIALYPFKLATAPVVAETEPGFDSGDYYRP